MLFKSRKWRNYLCSCLRYDDIAKKLNGVIGTNNHHYFFQANISGSSGSISGFVSYPNVISDTSLINYEMSDKYFDYYAYLSQVSGGERQIIVNCRETLAKQTLLLRLNKTGFNVYHTKEQINADKDRWSGYAFQNISDSSMVHLKNISCI